MQPLRNRAARYFFARAHVQQPGYYCVDEMAIMAAQARGPPSITRYYASSVVGRKAAVMFGCSNVIEHPTPFYSRVFYPLKNARNPAF